MEGGAAVSDTPKTDELAKRDFVPDGIWIRHARELERENAELREAVAIEQERSLYWRKIAGRKEPQP
jgi:hypothetical protein